MLFAVSVGALVVAFGCWLAFAFPELWVIGLLEAVQGFLLARLGLARVIIFEDRLAVRGVFGSRIIARSSVIAIDLPTIEWRDDKGIRTHAFAAAFSGPDPNPHLPRALGSRRIEAEAELREWLDRPPATGTPKTEEHR
jgi:hypothetical protein